MYTPINQWAEDDRPREKLQLKGKSALSDSELLAILIGSGSRNESAVQLCQRILASSNNNLNQLSKLSISQLTQFKGIGEAKIKKLLLYFGEFEKIRNASVEELKNVLNEKDALTIANYFINPKD